MSWSCPQDPQAPPPFPLLPLKYIKDPTPPHHNTVQRCTNITGPILISHTSTQIHHTLKTLTHTSNDTYKRTPKFSIFTFFSTQKVRFPKTKHPNIFTTCTIQQCTSSLISVDYPINTILSPPPTLLCVEGRAGQERDSTANTH